MKPRRLRTFFLFTFLPFTAGVAAFAMGYAYAAWSSADAGDMLAFSGALIGAAVTVVSADYLARSSRRAEAETLRLSLRDALGEFVDEAHFMVRVILADVGDQDGSWEDLMARERAFPALIHGIGSLVSDPFLATKAGRPSAMTELATLRREIELLAPKIDAADRKRREFDERVDDETLAQDQNLVAMKRLGAAAARACDALG